MSGCVDYCVDRVRESSGFVSRILAGGLTAVVAVHSPLKAQEMDSAGLADMSIEALAAIDITSVSKQRERLSDAPASIYVITADDIRHAGVTTIPEILRLAPNLQVARVDSVQYAISARGFNNAIGNKLLVLIDGRTVYTPLFSGVFWEMQGTMIEDIDRVEVISGPGASLWGANAVNGVINIITKPASETQDTLVSLDAGSDERGLAARFGGDLGENGAYRIYGKVRDWSNTQPAEGASARDEWDRGQVGFRVDWQDEHDRFTVQGDTYSGESQHRGFVQGFEITEVDISGAHLLGRWTRRFDNGSEMRLQSYYDYSKRDEIIIFRPETEIFDVEFQHAIPAGHHNVLWGAGYRYGSDRVTPGFLATFMPDSRDLDWQNIFLQDEIQVRDDTVATLGLKLEWNDFTGLEYLPSGRVAWKPADNRLVWAAVSRAVRAPSRFDRDVFSPGAPLGPPFTLAGGPDFESEVANVFELGYRAQPMETLSFSITGFYHDWNKLRSGSGSGLPMQIENWIEGEVYGVEAWSSYQPADFWVLGAGMLYMDKNLRPRSGSPPGIDVDNVTLHNDQDYQWSLRSSFDLPRDFRIDLYLRQVDELTTQPVPGYTELDARVAWLPSPDVELSVVARNLLHESHPEFGSETSRSEIERSVLLALRLWL